MSNIEWSKLTGSLFLVFVLYGANVLTTYSEEHLDLEFGSGLLKQCEELERYYKVGEVGNLFQMGLCFGVIQGTLRAMNVMANNKPGSLRICPPEGKIDVEHATNAILSFLRKRKKYLNIEQTYLLMAVFKDTYSCSEDKN